jgi:hypothetical protein
VHVPRAVLDPFSVFVQGERVLRGQLLALSPDLLSNVIVAHALGDPVPPNSSGASKARRVEEIIAAIRSRVRVA